MNWNEYKEQVKAIDPIAKEDLDEIEAKAAIVSAMIARRNALGLSQRDLAALCDIPQSSISKIESQKVSPTLDTLIKLFHHLGLNLSATPRV